MFKVSLIAEMVVKVKRERETLNNTGSEYLESWVLLFHHAFNYKQR